MVTHAFSTSFILSTCSNTSHKIKQTPNEIYLINYPQGTLSVNFMYVKAF